MPVIIAPECLKWQQTMDKITLVLPHTLKRSSDLDLFVSDKYAKVNDGSSVLEVFLAGEVDPAGGRCVVGVGGDVTVELKKKEAKTWDVLFRKGLRLLDYVLFGCRKTDSVDKV